MSKKKKIEWRQNDLFAIPFLDKAFGIGQILDLQMKNIVRIALYRNKIVTLKDVEIEPLSNRENLISLVATTREQLDYGVWHIFANKDHWIQMPDFPNEQYRENGWIGSKIYDATIMEDFINAFHGLAFWDDWADPLYFDKMLISTSKKPSNLLFKSK